MSSKRKKPLSEVEKLTMTNCIGRRYVPSCQVTPENNDGNEISRILLTDVRQNLADIFDEEESSSSDDSSFVNEQDYDADDDVIKELPEDTFTEELLEEQGKVTLTQETIEEPSKDEIFPAEVIEKLRHKENEDVSNDDGNAWELNNFNDGIHETQCIFAQEAQFHDVPAVLVDDDDSVLFPCYEQRDNSESNQSEKSNLEKEMEKICQDNKARMRLCKTLRGNGLFDTIQLETKIMSNLLCLQCVQDQKRD